ncbi:UDP-glucose:protein N-beta-glucosyltransferase [Aggregatibacter aphrophilus]|uniref:Predicted O-linked N-acetylglucosamine transferase, SPINDLY family n=2 Tax=Aggregatibacter aphrophilus TaxID=732 RepID=A0A336N7Z3_AGGAP|nr:adhesin [Aggregatibacter aphrophilus]KNE84887.1 adhesin [Aggregatibacter aphrophilus ATCC 33389]OBY54689.1 adhesin [Aggregatibacter aphrophilus]RDE86009.1 adhesin [Aggregatibacter aphrophilus]SSZ30341.1 Predicted O-linked N-acetylglucosamine transferase, SPINDLY family [Aggregatibacter aphrophilus]VEF42917.1 Predicted O-linked N-acetylglucosamine transferase, SPINDLY family [Aggregatibacter aphrophilus ATCC 33389]
MSEKKNPSVIQFEKAITEKNYEAACTELLDILNKIDTNFGDIEGIDFDYPQQLETLMQDRIVYFCTRMANAITQLFCDPQFSLSESGANRFFVVQRWLNLIFASSPYINADHILQTYNCNPERDSIYDIYLEPNKNVLMKFAVLYLPESNVNLNLDTMWEADKNICGSLCFALQSPRFIGTPAAFSKRSAILQWFPAKLEQFHVLDDLPSNISHDVYMHCSYDTAENKHNVKKALNQVIRSHLLKCGWQDRQITQIGMRNGKPVMVVVLEHFHSSHSIYRTHSTSMIAAREQFYLIGLGNNAVDQAGRDVFDEFHEFDDSNILKKLAFLKEMCEKNDAAVLYMPSIGMDLATIFVSNARFAPIQVIALGHPATTHSEFIEYVIVEDDYVGSVSCFSETLLRLPKDALPYVPSSLAPTDVQYVLRENPEVVNIGIAATTMKLNPYFLEALKVIRDRAKVKIHFHFALGQSSGITHPYIARFIRTYLGDDATAHPHSPYNRYLDILHNCDMMLNPFPFGNTNGIIDMVTLGLVGVCKTGPEVHEHIDEGLFKRLGLPEWLIADSVEDYIERAIRLAENHQERLALRRHIIENNGLKTLFSGDPSPMGKMLFAKLTEWRQTNGI